MGQGEFFNMDIQLMSTPHLLYFRRKVTAASMVWNERVALPAGRSTSSSYKSGPFNDMRYWSGGIGLKCVLLTLTPPGTTLPRRWSSVSGTSAAKFPMTSLDDFPPTTAGCASVGAGVESLELTAASADLEAPLIEMPCCTVGLLVASTWSRFLSTTWSWDGRRLVLP